MTFFVSACTVMARAMAPGVRSSLPPLWCEPSPLQSRKFNLIYIHTNILQQTFQITWYNFWCNLVEILLHYHVLSQPNDSELGKQQDGHSRPVPEWKRNEYSGRKCGRVDRWDTAARRRRSDCRPIEHGNGLDGSYLECPDVSTGKNQIQLGG